MMTVYKYDKNVDSALCDLVSSLGSLNLDPIYRAINNVYWAFIDSKYINLSFYKKLSLDEIKGAILTSDDYDFIHDYLYNYHNLKYLNDLNRYKAYKIN